MIYRLRDITTEAPMTQLALTWGFCLCSTLDNIDRRVYTDGGHTLTLVLAIKRTDSLGN